MACALRNGRNARHTASGKHESWTITKNVRLLLKVHVLQLHGPTVGGHNNYEAHSSFRVCNSVYRRADFDASRWIKGRHRSHFSLSRCSLVALQQERSGDQGLSRRQGTTRINAFEQMRSMPRTRPLLRFRLSGCQSRTSDGGGSARTGNRNHSRKCGRPVFLCTVKTEPSPTFRSSLSGLRLETCSIT